MLLAVIAVAVGAIAAILAGRLGHGGSWRREATPPTSGRRRPFQRPFPPRGLFPPGARQPSPTRPLPLEGGPAPLGGGPAAVDAGLLVVGLLAVAGGRLLPSTGAAAAMSVTGDALLAILAGRHWRHPGAILIAAGLTANLLVTAVDRGMPVRAARPLAGSGLHHQLTAGDHLRGLVDLIHLPVLGILASPGDLTLCAGAAVAAYWGMRQIGRPNAEGVQKQGWSDLGDRRRSAPLD